MPLNINEMTNQTMKQFIVNWTDDDEKNIRHLSTQQIRNLWRTSFMIGMEINLGIIERLLLSMSLVKENK